MTRLGLVILLSEDRLIAIDVMIVIGLIIRLIAVFPLLILGLVDGKSGFLNNSSDGFQYFLLFDIMFLIGANDVSDVRYRGFDIPCHDVDRPQMINLRQLEQLRLLLISVLLHKRYLRTRLSFILLLLARLNESQFRGHGEMCHRAVNDQLVQSILEEIFLHGYRVLEVADGHL